MCSLAIWLIKGLDLVPYDRAEVGLGAMGHFRRSPQTPRRVGEKRIK